MKYLQATQVQTSLGLTCYLFTLHTDLLQTKDSIIIYKSTRFEEVNILEMQDFSLFLWEQLHSLFYLVF